MLGLSIYFTASSAITELWQLWGLVLQQGATEVPWDVDVLKSEWASYRLLWSPADEPEEFICSSEQEFWTVVPTTELLKKIHS